MSPEQSILAISVLHRGASRSDANMKQGQEISCHRISAGESYSSQHRKVKAIQLPFSVMLIKSVETGFP